MKNLKRDKSVQDSQPIEQISQEAVKKSFWKKLPVWAWWLIGIVLAFSFILFSKFAEEFAKGGLLPPYVSVWIPNFIYAFIAYYLYKKAPK